jgi:hypothetical protein
MMAGACAAAAMTFAHPPLAAWEPSQRYPDPAVQSLDPSFNKYRLARAGVVIARMRCAGMSALAPPLGDKRTRFGHCETAAVDPQRS